MAATNTQLTVDQFRRLPEDSGGVYHELRNGEIVAGARRGHQSRRAGIWQLRPGDATVYIRLGQELQVLSTFVSGQLLPNAYMHCQN